MNADTDSVEILGIPIARLTSEAALQEVERLCEAAAPAQIYYANAHSLNLAVADPDYRAAVLRAAMVLNDGAGIALAARLQGTSFPANLNGSDFNPLIAELAATRGWSVYLLGAKPGVAERAARMLEERMPGLQIAGARDGYFDSEATDEVVGAVRATDADVVMVAMGNPHQELWLDRHLVATGARLGVGVGAWFDFVTGNVPRAPAWMNRLGIEWFFRLYQEPSRLWRRYLIGNPLFLWRVLRRRITS